ncbi:unnamed protein product [Wuchereria bancrofti]|uniref:G-protein coupled receptors family 1 profile domain-containing protein n=1 Tax=Wuchereria bancrofti TaxID=6293 RepID=A0A3P7EAY1_WUCBA|nr:unnamed protein product [Wuchereria bancrofti]
MNAAVNRTEYDDLKIASNSIHFYAYLVIGPMLVLVNTPVFLLVMLRKSLRTPYIVLAVVFLNNGLTGMSATLMGLQRWTISSVQQQLVVHHDCVFDVRSFFQKIIESFRVPSVYSSYFYVTLTLMSSTASLFSIIVMVIVVALLKRRFKAQFLSKNSCNRDLTHFIKNQKRYTHTALISCSFTFFLVVLPSMMKCVYVLDASKRSPIIVMLCVYLPLLNSFNMVLLFIYRQKDLQNAAIYGIKWLLCRNKQHIQPATTAGFLE